MSMATLKQIEYASRMMHKKTKSYFDVPDLVETLETYGWHGTAQDITNWFNYMKEKVKEEFYGVASTNT